MSTRGEFGFVDSNGSIYSIYVHCDAYLEGLGYELLTNVVTYRDALDYTLKYIAETEEDVHVFCSSDDYKDQVLELDREFIYLFVNDKWYVYSKSFNPLFLGKWGDTKKEDLPFFRIYLHNDQPKLDLVDTFA